MNETETETSLASAQCAASAWCPLSKVRTGMRVVIRQLLGSPEVSQRLRELGLGEDQMIRLLNRSSNVVCLVCNARLALNAQLAESILVEPIASPPRFSS